MGDDQVVSLEQSKKKQALLTGHMLSGFVGPRLQVYYFTDLAVILVLAETSPMGRVHNRYAAQNRPRWFLVARVTSGESFILETSTFPIQADLWRVEKMSAC